MVTSLNNPSRYFLTGGWTWSSYGWVERSSEYKNAIQLTEVSLEHLVDQSVKRLSNRSHYSLHDDPLEHMSVHMVTSIEGFNSLGAVAPKVIAQIQNPHIEFLGVYNAYPQEQNLFLVQNREVFI